MSALLRRLAASWNRFWFAPTDARPIGLLRIGVGFILAIQMAERIPAARIAFSDEGYLRRELAKTFVSEWQWSVLWLYDRPWFVAVLLAIGSAAAALFALGAWTRAAGLCAFIALVSIQNRNAIVWYGGDMLPRYFLFYLLLMPSDAAFSLSALRKRLAASRAGVASGADPRAGRFSPPTFEAWPVRLFQIQIWILYLFTGINKTYSDDYQDGVTLWYALVDPVFSRFYPWIVPLCKVAYPVLVGATIMTLWWEVAWPFMVPFRRLRPIALGIGLLVHGGIAVLMSIGWWGPLMLLSYLTFVSGRPFQRIRWLQVRQKRAQTPRGERLTIEYDPEDPVGAELAARVATVDFARITRLRARKGPLRARTNSGELAPAQTAERLQQLAPVVGRWVAAPVRGTRLSGRTSPTPRNQDA